MQGGSQSVPMVELHRRLHPQPVVHKHPLGGGGGVAAQRPELLQHPQPKVAVGAQRLPVCRSGTRRQNIGRQMLRLNVPQDASCLACFPAAPPAHLHTQLGQS